MSFSALYEKGQLEYDSTQTPAFKLWRKGKEEAEILSVPKTDGYIEQYNYFVRCLEEGTYPERVSPDSTRLSIELALAEKTSIREQRIFTL
jgi:hypothetical protein